MLIDLNCHLVINYHLSMHFEQMLKKFGPVYGWWLFPYERFNGMLSRVKHNGQAGGRMELTLLRNWVQTQLLYEYVCFVLSSWHILLTHNSYKGGNTCRRRRLIWPDSIVWRYPSHRSSSLLCNFHGSDDSSAVCCKPRKR